MKLIIISILSIILTVNANERSEHTIELFAVGRASYPNAVLKTILNTDEKIYLTDKTEFEETHINKAEVCFDLRYRSYLELTLTQNGSKLFAILSKKYIGQRLALVVNGEVIFAPNINTAITSGPITITGSYSTKELQSIAKKINKKKD